MKKAGYAISIILVIVVSGYLLLRFYLLKTKTIQPDYSHSKSVADLRPLVIAKIKQLVKDGSAGLYNLSIEKVNADVPALQFDMINATLIPDSAVLAKLNLSKKAPDDVFKIAFDTLRITGISLLDFLHKKNISLDTIYVSHPVVQVFHDPKLYNAQQRKQDSTETIYQKIKKEFNRIAINAIEINNGSLINTTIGKKDKIQTFNDVSISLKKLLFDSSTQFNNNRFFFSEDLLISSHHYLIKTPDSLFTFKIDNISVAAARHSIILNGVSFLPRGDKTAFEKKLKTMEDMVTLHFPKIVFNKVNWQQLMNNCFNAGSATLENGELKDYLDRRLPHSNQFTYDDFPQQLLMHVPVKLNIPQVNLHNFYVEYEEFSPQSMQSGKVSFSNINGTISNITNMPDFIQRNHTSVAAASGLFMQTVPIKANFTFNLSKQSSGGFSADVQIDSINKETVNPVAKSLGLFSINTGSVHKGNAHTEGNNFSAKASGTVLYNDLKLTVLKKGKDEDSLKNKAFISFIANNFLIKKNNPEKGKTVRSAVVVLQRDNKYGSFFNFVWAAIRKGLLKIIGAPAKG